MAALLNIVWFEKWRHIDSIFLLLGLDTDPFRPWRNHSLMLQSGSSAGSSTAYISSSCWSDTRIAIYDPIDLVKILTNLSMLLIVKLFLHGLECIHGAIFLCHALAF